MSLHQDAASGETTSSYRGHSTPARPSSTVSSRRPAVEWLGPRTVKVFAAAGLLDHEKATAARGGEL